MLITISFLINFAFVMIQLADGENIRFPCQQWHEDARRP